MGAIAAHEAISHAGIDKNDIDIIICGTGSPEYTYPSTAALIQNKLGITNNCMAYDIQAACSSSVFALHQASSFIKSGLCKYILVVSPEAPSRQLDWEDKSTCILFGDGAGAVVLSPVKENLGILASFCHTNGKDWDLLKIPNSGSILKSTNDIIDDPPIIKMNGNQVFKFAAKIAFEIYEEVLMQGLINNASTREILNLHPSVQKISDLYIDFVIMHQANKRIIKNFREKLREQDISSPLVPCYIENMGNTGAASPLITLYKTYYEGIISKENILVIEAFGAGLTWGANLIRWNLEKPKGSDLNENI